MIRLALAAILCAGCSEAPASGDHARTRELPVLGGSADTTHAAIVSIVTREGDPRPELCTGTIVSPRRVLTAGHCTIGRSPTDLVVGVGADSSAPERTLAIAAVHTPSRYTLSLADDARGLDIGVIDLVDDAGIAPIPIGSASGELDLFGFGPTSSSESRGKRAHGRVTIQRTCSTLLSFGDAHVNACHGDSGGPLLGLVDGREVLVALVSYGTDDGCTPPSYAVRADAYAKYVDGAADDACTDCPPAGEDCLADPITDGGSDAAASVAPARDGSCRFGTVGAASTPALLLLALAVAISRRCSGACSRS